MLEYSDAIQIAVIVAVIWWVLASFAVLAAAVERGYSAAAWFWMSIFFGPILAILYLLARPVKPYTKMDAIANLSTTSTPSHGSEL